MPYPLVVCVLLCAVLLSALLSLGVGVGDLSDLVFGDAIFKLRMYRCILAIATGAALAVAGVLSQGLFRNPLASPSVIGVSAGASLGGQIGMWLVGALTLPVFLSLEMVVPLSSLAGALAALSVLLVCIRGHHDALHNVLLIGVILSSLLGSIGALVVSLSQEEWELGRAVIAFTLGGLDGKGVQHVYLAVPIVVVAIVMAYRWAAPLNLLLSGEEEAQALGLNVQRARLWILFWIAVLCATAVAVGGGVAFVGLIIPNLLRGVCRADHRLLIPVAALGGAAFVVICDSVTRMVPSVGVLPLGVVTGCIGAPVFLWILIHGQRAHR